MTCKCSCKGDKKIKWAVLGSCGIAKRRTIPEGIVCSDNAELVAIYDVNQAANAELASELGVMAVGSQEELFASDVDAIYIATPAFLHSQQVIAVANAGKHVLCEKPLGMSNDEAQQMISACEKSNVQLGIAFMMRFLAQHQEVLKMIEAGKLGTPVYARAQLSCWFPKMENNWRQNPAKGGGGSLMDMGGHCIDLLEMFFGEVDKVSCFTNNSVHDYESEDSAVAMLSFKSGAIATVDAFFCVPDNSSKNVLEIYGSKGSVLARGTLGQGEAGDVVAFIEESGSGYDAQQARSSDDGIKISPTPVNMYRSEIEEFSQAILDGRKTVLNAEVGLRSQKVLTACYESAKTGKTITV
jgi:predicted dehydrogenase